MSSNKDIDDIQFYRVPFSHVPSLIKKRKVFIINGEAFVPEEEMVFLFMPHFRRILISGFEVSTKLNMNLLNDYNCLFSVLHFRVHVKLELIYTMMKDSRASLQI